MTKEITMPRLSETMPDGKVLVWYKKVNDQVDKGEVIAEVETDKANMDIEAVDSGVLSEILVPEGGVARVGEPIAVLNGKKVEAPQKKEEPEKVEKEEKPQIEEKEEEKPLLKKPEEKPSGLKASILVRELAEKLNVNLSNIKGTGPEGQIKKSDVLSAAERIEIEMEDTVIGERQDLTRIRETIARRMSYSKQNIPHFYVTMEVNADKLVEYYSNLRQKIEGITYNDIFIKAVALVLKHYPKLNASFKGEFIDLKKEINIGTAFATDKGLLVPVIHNCDKKSLQEIHDSTIALKSRVKDNKLKPEDMTGGTFSISNMGMYGVKEFTAIINPPESAGLAIGSIMLTPVVNDGEIKIGHTLNITLSGDHRVIDGADGAYFMKDLKKILENPEEINGNL